MHSTEGFLDEAPFWILLLGPAPAPVGQREVSDGLYSAPTPFHYHVVLALRDRVRKGVGSVF